VAVIRESTHAVEWAVNDLQGNTLGSLSMVTHAVTWRAANIDSYGMASDFRTDARYQPGTGRSQLLDTFWQGHRMDPTGLYWLGARYYDPYNRRFLSPDPLGHGSDPTLYAYADFDPVNNIDPDGRLTIAAPALVGLAGAPTMTPPVNVQPPGVTLQKYVAPRIPPILRNVTPTVTRAIAGGAAEGAFSSGAAMLLPVIAATKIAIHPWNPDGSEFYKTFVPVQDFGPKFSVGQDDTGTVWRNGRNADLDLIDEMKRLEREAGLGLIATDPRRVAYGRILRDVRVPGRELGNVLILFQSVGLGNAAVTVDAQIFSARWNARLMFEFGGSMDTRTPTLDDDRVGAAAAKAYRNSEPLFKTLTFSNYAAGHIPDVIAGGTPQGPFMPLRGDFNSSIGKQVQLVHASTGGYGYRYHWVIILPLAFPDKNEN
jgi:RHS repeat-associated protein